MWAWNVIADIYETVKGWGRGGGERMSSARIRGQRRAEGRKTMWMRVIVFEELCFMGLAAKSWVSESRTNTRRTCLSARHGARLDVLLILSWRSHWIPKRSNFPTQRLQNSWHLFSCVRSPMRSHIPFRSSQSAPACWNQSLSHWRTT